MCTPILPLLIADEHRPASASNTVAADSKMRLTIRRERILDGLGIQWRSFVLGLICFTLYSLAIIALHHKLLIILSAVMLTVVTILAMSRWNVAEQVRLASIADPRLDAILESLDTQLSQFMNDVDDVIIIAHSQGAYLAFELLRQRIAPRSTHNVRAVYTIGSGLRGILATKRTIQGAIWGQLAAFGILTVIFALSVPSVCLLMSKAASAAGEEVREALVPVVVFPVRQKDPLASMREIFDSIVPHSMLWITHVPNVGWILIAGSILMIVINLTVLKFHIENPYFAPIDILKQAGVQDWVEYFSPHDAVGRVRGLQQINGIETIHLPGDGRPVGDHGLTSYLSNWSPLPKLLADKLVSHIPVAEPESDRDQRGLLYNQLHIHCRVAENLYKVRALAILGLFGATFSAEAAIMQPEFFSWAPAAALMTPAVVSIVGMAISRRQSFLSIREYSGRVVGYGDIRHFPSKRYIQISNVAIILFLSTMFACAIVYIVELFFLYRNSNGVDALISGPARAGLVIAFEAFVGLTWLPPRIAVKGRLPTLALVAVLIPALIVWLEPSLGLLNYFPAFYTILCVAIVVVVNGPVIVGKAISWWADRRPEGMAGPR